MLLSNEGDAAGMRGFEPVVVPELLRTGEYARAIARASVHVPAGRVEHVVSTTLSRQAILSREEPPTLVFVLAESVVRTLVKNPLVMAGQLRYLADCASRPRVEIRVLPFVAGAHPGTVPFVIMDFARVGSVVHLPEAMAFASTSREVDVARYEETFTSVLAQSLDAKKSLDVILKLADEFGHRV